MSKFRGFSRGAALRVVAGLALAVLAAPAAHAGAMLDAGPEPEASPDPAGAPSYPANPGSGEAKGGVLAFHWQTTFTGQTAPTFHSPYAGANSFLPGETQETWDLTGFLGLRAWKGGELWANPEIDQGFGVSNTLGVAGYVSGEAYKVGKAKPYFRMQRLFFRQTFDLGGEASGVSAAANQFAGSQKADRVVVTFGKFGVADVFDTNRYAHDPRGDFLNWSIVESGAFDYAADAWGFTYGVAAEWYQGAWTLRGGLFDMSKDPNGTVPEHDFSQSQAMVELEHRHALGGHAGALRVGLWRTHARLARFDDAIAWGLANAATPDAMQVRKWADRVGGYVNMEQEVTPAVGVFLRASTADGNYASYDFTDIDSAVSGGVSLNGALWRRPADTAGLGFAVNAGSAAMKRYLAAGGLGLLLGDGQLPHAGTEKIVEANYAWHPATPLTVTFDWQIVFTPGYNRDRGLANVLGLRVHLGM